VTKKLTLQQRCYGAMRELGGTASVADVREKLGTEARMVIHAMARLCRLGFTERLGLGLYRVSGEAPTGDGRGQSPSSQANISKSRKYRKLAHHPRPIPKLELEKAWGWMRPFSVATNSLDED